MGHGVPRGQTKKLQTKAVTLLRGPYFLAILVLAGTAAAGGLFAADVPPADHAAREYNLLAAEIGRYKPQDAHQKRLAREALRPDALIQPSDRDPLDVVLRRTKALLDHLRTPAGAPDLAKEAGALETLGKRAAAQAPGSPERRALFGEACELRRRIAFANPLLDFDEILFIKRHRALYDHMCDQYYGMAQRPGGGLYVLAGAFGPDPRVRDILAGAVVQNGRLKGQKLSGGPLRTWNLSYDGQGNLHGEESTGGSFLAPDLSYDGKTIAFAYVECTGDRRHRRHTDPARGHWAEGRCYHVFTVGVDGSGLTQLTDGTWNDFDPCWLPNGRIVFISERRGGYLRCGRTCPTYTLYDMAADGSDILCLSPHETNEWNPSVTHDGRIIYTRWDYVDRHGCVTHLPWITTPDGRDARAVHGNFALREVRPDMELDIRAIPGSHRFVATAAPHHGQAFGSLVQFDPRVADDDAMAPVKRITPEVGFPESQGGSLVYGTPWPLSEDFYLCVYDSDAKHYGLYLVDAFGNKELLYRDPEISCLSPMPLRPRPMPPLIPDASQRLARDKPPDATLAVINVYDSLKPWPDATRIKALRVYQVIPMSVPSGSPPHEIGLRLPGLEGKDSVILARYVLGTVPVEEDGSAHFAVPAMRELFFQALDDRGLAVQSMRSATYLQPGERLVCQGCHEPKTSSPKAGSVPLALRREPSSLRPDVDGSNPFSYPRLVQPVLDKHCVNCHEKNPDKAPRLDAQVMTKGAQKWYASYFSLAPKFGFWQYGDRLRTTPGRFGARASKLYAMLQKGHNDLSLPAEDLHRLTLWLDSCSIFYGVYEKEGGEAQLRGEIVKPTLE